jgi:hypothetical protein
VEEDVVGSKPIRLPKKESPCGDSFLFAEIEEEKEIMF